MQKRLRLRFFLITWVLLLLLFGVMCLSVWVYYRSESSRHESQLQQVIEQFDAAKQDSTQFDPAVGMAAIRVQPDGVITELRLSRLTLSEEGAASLVKEILAREQETSGKVSLDAAEFWYKYSITDEGEMHIALAECGSEERALVRVQRYFIIFAVVGVVLTFAVSALLSYWATKPIADAWDKQNDFVYDATHELKTPLTVINANTDAVLSNPEASVGSQERWLGSIQGETKRMAGLVADLLFIAKADAGEIKLNIAPLRISDEMEGLCMEWETEFFEWGRRFDYAVTPNMIYHGDREKIRRLTEILLDNALKYTPKGGEVRLVMNRTRKMQLQILVSNTGELLTPQQQEKVFDRFYRVDASRTRDSGGYGLGLCIAKSIASLHNGEISASADGGINVFSTILGDIRDIETK